MTLPVGPRRNQSVGNAATSAYAFTWKIFEKSEVKVVVRDGNTEGALDVELVLDTDFSIASSYLRKANGGQIQLINSGQAWLTGGGNLKSGYVIVRISDRDVEQGESFRTQRDFYPERHEDAFDKQAIIAQQQQEEIDRCLKLPESISSSDFDPRLPSDILDVDDDTFFGVSADGTLVLGPTFDEVFQANQDAQAAAAAAQASANSAQSSEDDAALSAIQAVAAVIAAQLAESNAEIAQGLAEDAQAAAEAAQAAAEAAASAAEPTEVSATQTISNAEAVVVSHAQRQQRPVVSSGGIVDFPADLFGSDDTAFEEGFEIVVQGTSNANAPRMTPSDTQWGVLAPRGVLVFGKGVSATYIVDLVMERFIEKSRNT